MAKQYTLGEIGKLIDATVQGDPEYIVDGLAPLNSARSTQVSFLKDRRYYDQFKTTKAGAVLVSKEFAKDCPGHCLVPNNFEKAFLSLGALFIADKAPQPGIHRTAVIGKGCKIDKTASIGPHCVIGDNVTLGKYTIIGANTVIGNYCEIGDETRLYPNVTIYFGVSIGKDCMIQSGAVIGSDGFGNIQYEEKWQRIPQLGRVIIGDHVDVGGNTTIDRGALDDTVIGNGVKLDNLIQIAHNVKIGDNTAVAAGTGIAGSTKIGKNCMLAGQVGINGHIEICDRVILTATAKVSKSIREPGIYSSGLPLQETKLWRKNAVRFLQLDKMFRRINQMMVKEEEV